MLEVYVDGKAEWGRFGSLIDTVITYHHGYGHGKTLFCYYDVMLNPGLLNFTIYLDFGFCSNLHKCLIFSDIGAIMWRSSNICEISSW